MSSSENEDEREREREHELESEHHGRSVYASITTLFRQQVSSSNTCRHEPCCPHAIRLF